jgi:energy-coupling factor transport system substrate-specific component
MKRKALSLFLILLTIALAWLAYELWPNEDLNWAVTSFLILLLGLGLFYLRFERAKVSSKEMALIASLASLAVVGRILFAPFPNFKPTTFLILLAGYVFGPRAGFMVGSTVAVVSNMFFGQGPWTPWQMLAWGLVGATAGLYGRWRGERVRPIELAVFGAIWGFLFGWLMNTFVWLTTFFPLNWKTFVAANAASFWFDVSHASANVLFALLLTRSFLPILYRFRKKLTTTKLEVQTDAETKNG